MFSRYGLVLTLAVSAGVTAEDSCCIDADIAAAFPQLGTYSRSLPGTFPLELKDSRFEFVGSSLMRDGAVVSVAWKSDLPPVEARALVADAVENQGWRIIPTDEDLKHRYQRGFVSPRQSPLDQYQQFCRERDGQLSIRSHSTDMGTFTTVSVVAFRGLRDCDELMTAQGGVSPWRQGLIRLLPRLELPESVDMPGYGGSGSGGGSDDAHASISLETDVSSQTLMTSFNEQMVSQGWHLDGSFQGGVTLGTSWVREVDGRMLACILTAASGEEDRVRLRMHLEPL
ncbi:MAG: hypothetical protein AAGG55_05480 [Pseudomonadota bacterium]